MATNRRQRLLKQTTVTGVDFIYVHQDHATLDVFFLVEPGSLSENLTFSDVSIRNLTTGQSVDVVSPIEWVDYGLTTREFWDANDEDLARRWAEDTRLVARVHLAGPGGFGPHRLQIDHDRVDPYFRAVEFSFKVDCERNVDCAQIGPTCPPAEQTDVPLDYRARDFWSFRRALLEFAAQRYPDWQDRLEADVGVMLVEVMSALADEMAYYQDRAAREAWLETATQRRSVRRHARLVDYALHDGLGARGWIQVTVAEEEELDLTGTCVAGGSEVEPIYFEVGTGMRDDRRHLVSASRNWWHAYVWDEDAPCLSVGATELYVRGDQTSILRLEDGQLTVHWVLLRYEPEESTLPARCWLVRLRDASLENDPLALDPDPGSESRQSVTRLTWGEEHALPFELDLRTTTVHGNLVPITAGRTTTGHFRIGKAERLGDLPIAIERRGPDNSVAHLYSLEGSDTVPIVWLGEDPRSAQPEVQLVEANNEDSLWNWRRSLLWPQSSGPDDRCFTLDDGMWRRVVAYPCGPEEHVHQDCACGDGTTIRFGDDEFGRVPPTGSVFRVRYRLGGGSRGNVPPDTINRVAPTAETGESMTSSDHDVDVAPERESSPPRTDRVEITNPFATSGGLDPEPLDEARKLAPEAFRSIAFRAVRPEDYAEAAERLPWVQRAQARSRWTGSWLSTFVTADPRQQAGLSEPRKRELREHVDRFRQVGRDVHVLDPRYVDLDLRIRVCVEPDAYAADVKVRALRALFGEPARHDTQGFFEPDRFTFGRRLDRVALEAAVASVPGVRAVMHICKRRRGWYDWERFTGLSVEVGVNEVVRVCNDPLHPEWGVVEIKTEGGL